MFLTRPSYTCRRVLNLPSYVCCCLFLISFYKGIVCLGQNEYQNDNEPKSGLCQSGKNATCSHQVASLNLSDDACSMLYHTPTSQSCSDGNFTGDVNVSYSYGQFALLTYLFKQSRGMHKYPAFNLTFSNIKWTSMKMRFKENESSGVSLCREFQVSSDIESNFQFYFDCLWKTEYENKPYIFQFQITTRSSETYLYKYFFRVPTSDGMDEDITDISDWEVFSVVDITDGTAQLSLTVQAVPISLNVTTYKIQVIRQLWDNTWVLRVATVIHRPDVPSFTFCYDTRSRPGIYKFAVEIIHPECNPHCLVNETPSIVIVDLPAKSTLILFVGFVILFPICLTLYFIWRRKCETNLPTPDPTHPPKFLLIYNPVSVEHINSMVEVAKYFNKVCHLQAMVDVLGIPQSEHKDPMRWYIDSFTDADFVGIFPSPRCSSMEKDAVMKSLIYSNTNAIAQSQLRLRLCSPGAKCKFFGVALPGACWDTLPDEAQALKRYTLPRDLDPLLVLIGVVPQCDQGKGFTEALACVHPERETLVLTLNGGVGVPGPSCASSPTPTPVTCCAALSTSDPDLISTSQQVTSCMSTPASSDDQLSLLGNY